MNGLLLLMQAKTGLDLHEEFEIPPEIMLREAFYTLTKCSEEIIAGEMPVLFSTDCYGTHASNSDDKFIQLIEKKIPNSKICHMRQFFTNKTSHWHALFAKIDALGELEKIVITDSRSSFGEGLTGKYDKARYGKLFAGKVHFKPGPQQPIHSQTCWIYALTNLYSLVMTGEVYKEQKLHKLRKEIITKFAAELEPVECLIPDASPLVSTSESQITVVPPSVETPVNKPDFPKTSATFFHSRTIAPSEPESLLIPALLFTGGALLTATSLTMMIFIPVTIPVGILLLATGLTMMLCVIPFDRLSTPAHEINSRVQPTGLS